MFCLRVCQHQVVFPGYSRFATPKCPEYYQYFQGVKCLAQGHIMAVVGFEPERTASSQIHVIIPTLQGHPAGKPCQFSLQRGSDRIPIGEWQYLQGGVGREGVVW